MGTILAILALSPVALIGAFVLGQQHPTSKAQPDWIYGPRGALETSQKGIIVLCQSKTTSLPFANREYAEAGDVVVQTCRAVKGRIDPKSGKTTLTG